MIAAALLLSLLAAETAPPPAMRNASSRLAEISILSAERKISAAAERPDPPSLALPRLLLERAKRAFGEGRFEEAWQIAREASAAADASVAAGPRLERTAPEGAVPDRLFDLEVRLAEARSIRGDTDWRVAAVEDLLLVARTAAARGDIDEAIRFSDRGLLLLEAPIETTVVIPRLDLATALRVELERLPGMTPERIRALLWFREEVGFRMTEDLILIPGFDDPTVTELLPLVEIGR